MVGQARERQTYQSLKMACSVIAHSWEVCKWDLWSSCLPISRCYTQVQVVWSLFSWTIMPLLIGPMSPVNQYLEREIIAWMDWPVRSQDLNPIKHIWDMLQRAISVRPVQPTTTRQLRVALLAEWAQAPQFGVLLNAWKVDVRLLLMQVDIMLTTKHKGKHLCSFYSKFHTNP